MTAGQGVMGDMSGVVTHIYHWDSHRLASGLALVTGALLLLLGGFVLATRLGGHTSPPNQIEVPFATSPGTGP
jgi:hypothetical protein